MRKTEINQWLDGINIDAADIAKDNKTLSSALNATFITMNGNEMILLNDMGNGRVESAYLPAGYVPVGMTSFGGITYVASHNPLTKCSLIGCFPSPERNISSDEMDAPTATLCDFGQVVSTGIAEELTTDDYLGSLINSLTQKLLLTQEPLRPGDKFSIEMRDRELFRQLITLVANGRYRLTFAIINELGDLEDLNPKDLDATYYYDSDFLLIKNPPLDTELWVGYYKSNILLCEDTSDSDTIDALKLRQFNVHKGNLIGNLYLILELVTPDVIAYTLENANYSNIDLIDSDDEIDVSNVNTGFDVPIKFRITPSKYYVKHSGDTLSIVSSTDTKYYLLGLKKKTTTYSPILLSRIVVNQTFVSDGTFDSTPLNLDVANWLGGFTQEDSVFHRNGAFYKSDTEETLVPFTLTSTCTIDSISEDFPLQEDRIQFDGQDVKLIGVFDENLVYTEQVNLVPTEESWSISDDLKTAVYSRIYIITLPWFAAKEDVEILDVQSIYNENISKTYAYSDVKLILDALTELSVTVTTDKDNNSVYNYTYSADDWSSCEETILLIPDYLLYTLSGYKINQDLELPYFYTDGQFFFLFDSKSVKSIIDEYIILITFSNLSNESDKGEVKSVLLPYSTTVFDATLDNNVFKPLTNSTYYQKDNEWFIIDKGTQGSAHVKIIPKYLNTDLNTPQYGVLNSLITEFDIDLFKLGSNTVEFETPDFYVNTTSNSVEVTFSTVSYLLPGYRIKQIDLQLCDIAAISDGENLVFSYEDDDISDRLVSFSCESRTNYSNFVESFEAAPDMQYFTAGENKAATAVYAGDPIDGLNKEETNSIIYNRFYFYRIKYTITNNEGQDTETTVEDDGYTKAIMISPLGNNTDIPTIGWEYELQDINILENEQVAFSKDCEQVTTYLSSADSDWGKYCVPKLPETQEITVQDLVILVDGENTKINLQECPIHINLTGNTPLGLDTSGNDFTVKDKLYLVESTWLVYDAPELKNRDGFNAWLSSNRSETFVNTWKGFWNSLLTEYNTNKISYPIYKPLGEFILPEYGDAFEISTADFGGGACRKGKNNYNKVELQRPVNNWTDTPGDNHNNNICVWKMAPKDETGLGFIGGNLWFIQPPYWSPRLNFSGDWDDKICPSAIFIASTRNGSNKWSVLESSMIWGLGIGYSDGSKRLFEAISDSLFGPKYLMGIGQTDNSVENSGLSGQFSTSSVGESVHSNAETLCSYYNANNFELAQQYGKIDAFTAIRGASAVSTGSHKPEAENFAGFNYTITYNTGNSELPASNESWNSTLDTTPQIVSPVWRYTEEDGNWKYGVLPVTTSAVPTLILPKPLEAMWDVENSYTESHMIQNGYGKYYVDALSAFYVRTDTTYDIDDTNTYLTLELDLLSYVSYTYRIKKESIDIESASEVEFTYAGKAYTISNYIENLKKYFIIDSIQIPEDLYPELLANGYVYFNDLLGNELFLSKQRFVGAAFEAIPPYYYYPQGVSSIIRTILTKEGVHYYGDYIVVNNKRFTADVVNAAGEALKNWALDQEGKPYVTGVTPKLFVSVYPATDPVDYFSSLMLTIPLIRAEDWAQTK